ncbi:MAG: acetyltransferase, partial [Oxalobacteraceae bacterium]
MHRARLAAGAFDTAVDIELADTTDRREDACSLINRRYAWRGYGSHHTLPAHRASATFTASDAARVLGTVTLVVDSDAGLAADKIFAD